MPSGQGPGASPDIRAAASRDAPAHPICPARRRFPDHTRYTDRVSIDAGVLTPVIALSACVF
ncbi:MAG: hypothetical protein AAF494_12925 [Pseudomonadota bacterium]